MLICHYIPSMTLRTHWFISIALFVSLLSWNALAQEESEAIQITAPADGTVVALGSTLKITVTAEKDAKVIGVLTDGHFPNLRFGLQANEFLQDVPETIEPKEYRLTAIGTTTGGPIFSKQVTIRVEPQGYPVSFEMDPPALLWFEVGDSLPIEVTGVFQDSSKVYLSRSSKIKFSSKNPSVATVDEAGNVTAVGAGETIITVETTNPKSSESDAYGAVLVRVKQPKPSGPEPVITRVTPDRGVPGETVVTIEGTDFGAERGDGMVCLGTLESENVKKWSNTQIVAVVPPGSQTGVVEVLRNGLHSDQVIPFTITTPFITGVTSRVSPGGEMEIDGGSFGATQGDSAVFLGKLKAEIVSWTGELIKVKVPAKAVSGEVTVSREGHRSNGVWFAVEDSKPPK